MNDTRTTDLDQDLDSGPDSRLGYQLWRAQRAVERALDDGLKPLGLTITQVAALIHLHRQPGLSGAELARRLDITPQSTATLLKDLERHGFVTRSAHPVHRTVIEVSITAKGRRIMRRGLEIIVDIDHKLTAGMSTGERQQLGDLLARCQDQALELVRQEP